MDEPVIQEDTGAPGEEPKTGRFRKGDPRINRKGRPRTHDQLRKLIQITGGELIPELQLTRVQALIRMMFASKNPLDHSLILEHGWGKVKDEHDVTFKGMTDGQLRQFITDELGITSGGSQGSETPPSNDPNSTP